MELPKLIGHRGARAEAPENTLAGFRVAAAQGATWIETDVMLTRDGAPVLIHDDTLERTTDGRGNVADHDLDALRKLDAGVKFSPAFQGEKIPTLQEGIAEALKLGVNLNLEIKPAPGQDAETARVALEVAQSMWPADRPPPLISSFSVEALKVAKEVAPAWPRGYLIERKPADWREIADMVGAATVNIDGNGESLDSVRDFVGGGRPVLAWTVNDPARAQALLDAGVAGIFTDSPGKMKAALEPAAPAVPSVPAAAASAPAARLRR